MSGTRAPRTTPNSRLRAALFAVPAVLGLLGAAAAPAAPSPAPSTGLRAIAPLTCRGQGVDPDAPVRHRTEIVIDAPLRTIWKLQTDVENWPSWQPSVESVDRLGHGPLRPGAAFRWTLPIPPHPSTPATSLDITSTVRQIKNQACVRWTGPAIGEGLRIDGVHVWTFTEVEGGVRVATEESHAGPQVEADVPTASLLLRQGLETWLQDLKSAAEARTHR
ncbi:MULTISPECIES: SRPBCC family protein [Streptomyces]|uniref:Putative polyketide cyclase or reductase n=3 Tax=Streptomyces venezuelae TaxID=54571 RepID=F2R5S4_STRVP|nr:SRPBCC family protein [Streptomyces venezuelae]APE19784.1 polyketide cyclase /reductase [Streptomyces venezuelae]QER97191.1 polyketide cyclase /reductase [Streptomyces venezuelae ATCC 10712]CCA53585.1 putative polyketide cyclase or reductase [Streptomyces venezuelae ATCC 10712]